MFAVHILRCFMAVCIHRVTYSPIVYPTNQSMWPNMSRRGLRSQCGEPCGYLLASSSSQATTESSSSSYDVHAHAGVFVLLCVKMYSSNSSALKDKSFAGCCY